MYSCCAASLRSEETKTTSTWLPSPTLESVKALQWDVDLGKLGFEVEVDLKEITWQAPGWTDDRVDTSGQRNKRQSPIYPENKISSAFYPWLIFVTLSAWFAKTRLPFLFTSSWPASRSMMIRSGKSKATWFLEYFPFRSWSKPLPFVLTGTGCLLCWRCFAFERRCRLRLSTTLKRRSRCTYLVLPWCSLFKVCTITEDVKKRGYILPPPLGSIRTEFKTMRQTNYQINTSCPWWLVKKLNVGLQVNQNSVNV